MYRIILLCSIKDHEELKITFSTINHKVALTSYQLPFIQRLMAPFFILASLHLVLTKFNKDYFHFLNTVYCPGLLTILF